MEQVRADREEYLREAKKACKKAFRAAQTWRYNLPELMMLRGRYEWIRGKPQAAEERVVEEES
jgi:hypothetical protein